MPVKKLVPVPMVATVKKSVVRRAAGRRPLAAVDGLLLPENSKGIDPDFSHYVMLIYGRPGVGKSTFAGSYPDVLFFSTERVSKYLDVADFNSENGGVVDWGVFRRGVELLEENPGRYASVGIDTITSAFKQCQDYVCRRLGIEHPSDMGYGKGWDAVNSEFTIILQRILQSRRSLVMTAHSKEMEIVAHSGKTYTRIQPNISGSAYNVIKAITDFVFYAEFVKDRQGQNRRVLFTTADEIVEAKHAGDLPSFLPLEREGGYDLVRRAFEGEEGLGIPLEEITPTKQTSKGGIASLTDQKMRAARKGGPVKKTTG